MGLLGRIGSQRPIASQGQPLLSSGWPFLLPESGDTLASPPAQPAAAHYKAVLHATRSTDGGNMPLVPNSPGGSRGRSGRIATASFASPVPRDELFQEQRFYGRRILVAL